MDWAYMFFWRLFCGIWLIATFGYCQAGWGPDVRLTYMQGGGWYPRAACCGDTIHLVWWQHYGVSGQARDEIYYLRSTDAGESWSDPVRLSVEDDDASVQPTVGVNGNFVHVVWKEEHAGVCYRKSIDGGATWLQIDTLPDAGLSQPWVCVDLNTLYVVSGASTGFQVFTKSTDNGNTWQPGQQIMHSCGFGRISKIDSLLLILTHQDNPYSVETYCLRSFDAGQTWNDIQCVSAYDSVHSFNPAMTTDDSGGIHIDWCDYKYSPYPWTGDIFYRASRDSGNSWGEIDSLTVQHRAVASDILAEGNNLHLVWEDDRNGFDNNFEIYYRMSSDLGRTWGPEIRLTNAPYKSISPSLTCGGGYLHLFWSDLRDYGNNSPWMLYYKRKDLSGGISELEGNLSSGIDFGVFPDPFSDKLGIRFGRFESGYSIKVKFFDVSGKEVIAYEIKGKKARIDTRSLPSGVYFVEVEAGGKKGIKKVVKIE